MNIVTLLTMQWLAACVMLEARYLSHTSAEPLVARLIQDVADSLGDGGSATKAFVNLPTSVAIDKDGNLYFGEKNSHRVRRVDARTGIITTVAGTGAMGNSEDGVPPVKAALNYPRIALDRHGNLFIGEVDGNRIRKVDLTIGIVTTVAGTGQQGYSGDGGPAVQAQISRPFAMAFDEQDNLYFTDTENMRIRRIDGRTGIITTVAGDGRWGFSGDGGPATKASLARPHTLAIEQAGDLIIGDSFNQRIRRVNHRTGIITTIAGTGYMGSSGDNGPATKATFHYFGDFAIDSQNNLLLTGIADQSIRRIDLKTGVITRIAGTGKWGFVGDGGAALLASFHLPNGICIDNKSNVYVADFWNGRIRKIDAKTGIATTVAGAKESVWPGGFHFHFDSKELADRIRKPVVLTMPERADVRVRKNLDYSQSTDPRLTMDVYFPSDLKNGERRPAVLLVHGTNTNSFEVPPKEWGEFASRARLLALEGMVAVVFNHRLMVDPLSIAKSGEDVQAALRYVRRNASSLNINADKIAIATFENGSFVLGPLIKAQLPYIRCYTGFYPQVDIESESLWWTAFAPSEIRHAYSAATMVGGTTSALPPVFLAWGSKDQSWLAEYGIKGINRFIKLARDKGADIEAVEHNEFAFVGFDYNKDDERSRSIIRRWVAFLAKHLDVVRNQ